MIRVLIADDHGMVRQGLSHVLQTTADIEVVGLAANGREALRFCTEYVPDVVLMDIMMPEMDGLAATRFIRRMQSNIKIILFSAQSDEASTQAAYHAGAHSFLSKDLQPTKFWTPCALFTGRAKVESVNHSNNIVYEVVSVAGMLLNEGA
jgi:NarL family two-component system response regulator LiaR